MKPIEIAALAFGLLLVLGGGLVVAQRSLTPAGIPADAAHVERALALPGLVAIATVGAEALARLEPDWLAAGSDPSASDVDEDRSPWLVALATAGVDPSRDVEHLTAAVYAGSAGQGVAVALTGRFDPPALERAMLSTPGLEVRAAEDGTAGSWYVTALDPESCAPSGPWALQLAPDRLLWSTIGRADALRARLAEAAPSAPRLERFQRYRDGQLAGLAVFVPRELPSGIEHPFLQMPVRIAHAGLAGFEALYLRAGARSLPPGATVAAMLEAPDAGTADGIALRWTRAIESSKEDWSATAPALAALHDAVDVHSDGPELHLAVGLDDDLRETLRALPEELMGVFLGGFGSGSLSLGETSDPGPDRIDESPDRFAPEYAAASLPSYDPGQPFAGPTEWSGGPFGVRVAALSLPIDPEASGPEITVQALSTGLGNLGDQVERARLRITGVSGASGEPLLAVERCGADRNDRASVFARSFGDDLLEAKKRVRLRPGASAADVARVTGRIALKLPSKTESVVIDASEGTVAERAGARLELVDVSPRGVSWRTSGAAERVLQLRALNGAGAHLADESRMTSGAVLGGGSSGQATWAGNVAKLEVVFATEEEDVAWDFALESLRPGSDGEQIAPAPIEFVSYPVSRVARQFKRALARNFEEGEEPRAAVRTGPFLVVLENLWAFGGLVPRLQVYAPDIPNLEHSMNGLELALERIGLRDGSFVTPDDVDAQVANVSPPRPSQWSQVLELATPFREKGLTGSAHLETGASIDAGSVARLEGSLVMRQPRGLETLVIPDVALGATVSGQGVELTLAGLGRDEFTLRAAKGGEKILGVRAYNADGALLWGSQQPPEQDAAGWLARFQAPGLVERIEVVVARRIEQKKYPYVLEF